jgi:hypothetical protein
MNRREFLVGLFGMAPLASFGLLLADQGRGKGRGRGREDDQGEDERGERGEHGESRAYFRREDYGAVRRYYNGPRDLPPGLRKKYYRTGKLPPGWERKIQPFPPELVRVLPPPPPNCERGYIDGVAVVYDRRTRIILDSIDLISAIAGR